jgi:hypothetical protein
VPKDREPPLKDRARIDTNRREPDIVVCTSASGHVADAKSTLR